jgi:hypothetical protein
MIIRSFALTLGVCLAAHGFAAAQGTPALGLDRTPGGVQLSLNGEAPFHTTANAVTQTRTLQVDGTEVVVALWNETADGLVTPHYGISLDGGASFAKITATSYEIGMDHGGAFDPLVGLPALFADSPLQSKTNVYFVQYHTQALDVYQDSVRALGARIHGHVTNHANLVRMSPATRDLVEQLSFVRAVVPYHVEYRMEEWILDRIGTGAIEAAMPYNIWVQDRGIGDQFAIQSKIEAIGGEVRDISERSSLVGAMLTESQLLAVAAMDQVQHIDRYSELSPDLNVVRQFSGADGLETATGFTGLGVAGESADTGVRTTHNDFQHHGGVLLHGGQAGSTSHGTNVHGIMFGDGTVNSQWRGILPDGNQIFADSDSFGWLNVNNPANRANHTAELVDPFNIYRGLFQTNSTGSNRTADYTTISANMDQIVLDNDVNIQQSQSNAGTTQSRPEAWGKNMIGVGGIKHKNTLTRNDDDWTFGGSIGPATDGRLKPDLAHFYDSVTTPSSSNNSSYSSFSGTSAATPCTTSHFGLFFQMWHNDVFNNNPSGATAFDSAPHFETAKAAMINTAIPWDFSGTGHDLSRFHQGFGAVNVDNMYDLRDKTIYRDREPLANLQTKTISVEVAPGTPRFKATMVYRDHPGVVGAAKHRINDITLKVTSPAPQVYWGNVGLDRGNESLKTQTPNDVDTVENVWITNPIAGTWTVEIIGSDINTPLPGAAAGDFSIWITGGTEGCGSSNATNYCTAGTSESGCQASVSAAGVASASAASGFTLSASSVEGNVNGQFYFGTSGQQGIPWGNGTSFRCVVPPTKRGGLMSGGGTNGACDGSFAQDMNARWTAQPAQNPGAGTVVQAQFWYRDPGNTSNQTTSFSDAIEFSVCP